MSEIDEMPLPPASRGYWRNLSIPYWVSFITVATISITLLLSIDAPFPAGFAFLWFPFLGDSYRRSAQLAKERRRRALGDAGSVPDEESMGRAINPRFWMTGPVGRVGDEVIFAVSLSTVFLAGSLALSASNAPEAFLQPAAADVVTWSLAALGAGVVGILISWLLFRRRMEGPSSVGADSPRSRNLWRLVPLEYVLGAVVTTFTLIVLNRINPDVHLSLVVLPFLPLILHYVVVRQADRHRGHGSERPNIEPRRLHASLALVAFAVAAVTIGSSIMVGVWLAATSSSWTANASAWMWAGAATFALVIPAAIPLWALNRRATVPSSDNPSSAAASGDNPHDHRMV